MWTVWGRDTGQRPGGRTGCSLGSECEGERLREEVSDTCLHIFLWRVAHNLPRQPRLVSELKFLECSFKC